MTNPVTDMRNLLSLLEEQDYNPVTVQDISDIVGHVWLSISDDYAENTSPSDIVQIVTDDDELANDGFPDENAAFQQLVADVGMRNALDMVAAKLPM